MLLVKNHHTNPYFNLAAEEYLLKQRDEDFFMLWQNAPCIVIGKNQNAHAQIHHDYVKENDITVVRRLSGGGAVFHDLGNINFTFITKKNHNEAIDFSPFTLPIIHALKDLNVNAEFSGRNDILIDGKKFSGNAQYYYKERLLHHGTLLFSGNLTDLAKALKPKPQKIEDKAVQSTISRVTNIKSHLSTPMTVQEFLQYLENPHTKKQSHLRNLSFHAGRLAKD
jgi:lipoate---protein ligase